jgi:hypothetical protein
MRLSIHTASGARAVVETKHDRRPWEVVVEPDLSMRIVVVVTEHPVD